MYPGSESDPLDVDPIISLRVKKGNLFEASIRFSLAIDAPETGI